MGKVGIKCLPLVLAGALVSSGFAGCASQPKPQDTTVSEKTGVKAEELVQKTTIKFFCRSNANRESRPDNQKVLQFIQDKSGIKLEATAIPQDNYKDKMNLMIASGEDFDCFSLIGYGEWADLKQRDAIMPLNELLDKYAPNAKKYIADGLKTGTDKDGKLWALPRAERFPTGYALTLREDWLKKFGMTMPDTIKGYEDYLEAVKTKDPNGNGKSDEIALLPYYNAGGLTDYFLQAPYTGFFGARYTDSNGKVMPIYAHPGYKTMLAKLSDWYKKGYINKDFFALKEQQNFDTIATNVVGSVSAWYSLPIRPALQAKKNDPGILYSPVPNFKDAPAKPVWGANPKNSPMLVINKNSKNAPFIMKLVDWIFADPANATTVTFGIEGEHWKWADSSSKKQIELIGNATDKYDQFYGILPAYYDGLMPEQKPDPQNAVNFEYDRQEKIIRTFAFTQAFDYFVGYNKKGTPAENLTNDGATKMQETITKIIIGEMKIDDWDKTVSDYMKLEGNILSDMWTKQYNELAKK